MNKKVLILLCVILIVLPIALNFIIQLPALFPIVGEPVNWLMFWATYLGAAASFVMIIYTGFTLKQNKEQLDELKRQWTEEHKPEIAAHFYGYDQFFYLRIKNVSKVTVSNISITITRDPQKEIIWHYDKWKKNIEDIHFSIEPNGYRDIEVMGSCHRGIKYDDYIGIQFDFNEKYKYSVNLSFDEATLLNPRLEEQALLDTISQIADKIDKIKL